VSKFTSKFLKIDLVLMQVWQKETHEMTKLS
jgi:hypothetical protein